MFTTFLFLLGICALLQFYLRQFLRDQQKQTTTSPSGNSAEEEEENGERENKTKADDDPERLVRFTAFQRNYLIVYYTVMCADWLQGPYVYALYAEYGFNKEDIALLFIAGFTSSMLFGTFVGSIADKYGRKRMCMLFGVLYSIACITKLYNDFNILLLGRLLSGIATSLLYSAFESWMVSEHTQRGYSHSQLSGTFSLATLGNGVVAIVAGLIASFVANHYGYAAPFMVSLGFLVMATIIVSVSWTENFGDANATLDLTFTNGLKALKQDRKILLLGCVQSLFEASMYTFVFMWTPSLEEASSPGAEPIDYGIVFACYMVCIMIGSSLFSIVLKQGYSLEKVGSVLLLLGLGSFLVPVFFKEEQHFVLYSFFVFEVCCGLYFPCFGTLRGIYIPEATRATLMNLFRVPLNFLVVVILTNSEKLANSTVFCVCVLWMGVAFICYTTFVANAKTAPARQQGSTTPPEDATERESPAAGPMGKDPLDG